jgi:hypothetical protein
MPYTVVTESYKIIKRKKHILEKTAKALDEIIEKGTSSGDLQSTKELIRAVLIDAEKKVEAQDSPTLEKNKKSIKKRLKGFSKLFNTLSEEQIEFIDMEIIGKKMKEIESLIQKQLKEMGGS